jgi:hypothetical protein
MIPGIRPGKQNQIVVLSVSHVQDCIKGTTQKHYERSQEMKEDKLFAR